MPTANFCARINTDNCDGTERGILERKEGNERGEYGASGGFGGIKAD